MTGLLLSICIVCLKSCVGLITKPYETYRRIVNHGSIWELFPIGVLLSGYFVVASLVKTAAFHPFVITKYVVLIAFAVIFTYIITVVLLWGVGKLVGGKGTVRAVALGWAYTLIPTLLWFLGTSLLYVLFPPPRTGRPLGILFSTIFLVFSSVLFFWKGMLTYLTMRFAMRLDFWRIMTVICIVGGVMVFYSMGMYRLGVFRIPFI